MYTRSLTAHRHRGQTSTNSRRKLLTDPATLAGVDGRVAPSPPARGASHPVPLAGRGVRPWCNRGDGDTAPTVVCVALRCRTVNVRCVDLTELHRRALEQAAGRIGQVTPDQLPAATPCGDWSVRALLNHMIGGNRRFAAVARGEPVGPATGEYPPMFCDDPVSAFVDSSHEILDAFAAPGGLDRTFPVRIGDVPGRVMLGLRLVDTVVHTWDLARATGQDERLDPELVAASDEVARSTMGEGARGPGRPFGYEIAISADAPVEHRLVAFLGRQP